MADRTESRTIVAAEPAQVLDVIADFDSYPEWTSEVRRTEVLSEDEGGWAEQVRFTLDAGVLKDTYTLEYTWDIDEDGTGVVSWTLVEAGVLKAMDGAYTLRAAPEGTEVTYELTVDLRMPMIGMLRRKAEKTIIDAALGALRNRVEG